MAIASARWGRCTQANTWILSPPWHTICQGASPEVSHTHRTTEGRPSMPYIGQPLKRFEDPKLVTGQGSFVDDIQLPDMLHAAILRSPHAHARIRAIDSTEARHIAGVVTVLTGADIAGVLGEVPTRAMVGGWDVDDMQPVEQPVLARDKVYYVGQPVAVVVAQNRYLAKDAVARLWVDYELVPPVLDPLVALQAETTPIHATVGS